jgi:hypothetical protein
MKKLKIEKFSLSVFLILFIMTPVVKSLGVSSPMPPNLRMMQGDTAEIAFAIQAISSTAKLSCSCYTQGFDPLIITFKEKTITINPGQAGVVYGNVFAPENAPIKDYTGKIFASCTPVVETQELSGSRVSQTSGIKYTLSVVGSEADRNVPEMPKPTKKETPTISTSSVITIIIIILAVLAIGVYYWSERRKKK